MKLTYLHMEVYGTWFHILEPAEQKQITDRTDEDQHFPYRIPKIIFKIVWES